MRCYKHEQTQAGQEVGVAFKASAGQNTCVMRVGDHLLDDPVASLGVGIDQAIAQRMGSQ